MTDITSFRQRLEQGDADAAAAGLPGLHPDRKA